MSGTRPNDQGFNDNFSNSMNAIGSQFRKLNLDPVLNQNPLHEKPGRDPILRQDTPFTEEEESDEEEEHDGPHQGWSLYRAKPTVAGQELNWSSVTRSRMHLTQEDLIKLVQGQKKGHVAKTYSSLGRLKRKHIDELIEDLKKKDKRFNWNIVYIKDIRKDITRRTCVTTAINLVLEKVLKPGVQAAPRVVRKAVPRSRDNVHFESKRNSATSPLVVEPPFHGHTHGMPQPHLDSDSNQRHVQHSQATMQPSMAPNPPMPPLQGHGPHGDQRHLPHPNFQQHIRPQQPTPVPQTQPHTQQRPQFVPGNQGPQQGHSHQPQPQADVNPLPPFHGQTHPHPHPHSQSHGRFPSEGGAPPVQPREQGHGQLPPGVHIINGPPPMQPREQGHGQLPPGVHVINGPPPQARHHIPPPPMMPHLPKQNPLSQPNNRGQPIYVKQAHTTPTVIHLGKRASPKDKYAPWDDVDSSIGDEDDLFELEDDSSVTEDSFIPDEFEIKGHKQKGSRPSSRGRGDPVYRRPHRPSSKHPGFSRRRGSLYDRGDIDLIPAKTAHRGQLVRSASHSHGVRPSLKIYNDRIPQTPISSRGISPLGFDYADDLALRRERDLHELERDKEINDYVRKRLEAKEEDLRRREQKVERRERKIDRADRPERRLSLRDSYDRFDRMDRMDRDHRPRIEIPRTGHLPFRTDRRRYW